MKLIFSRFDPNKQIIIIYSLPNQNISDDIQKNLRVFYEAYQDQTIEDQMIHLDIGSYLSYIFQQTSAWFPERKETLMLTLYFEEHENTHFFSDIMEETIKKLKEIPNFTKALYINTPHADNESYKIFGRTINILTDCFFEVSKLHATYNLGISEVLMLGYKGAGKTSIVDYLIHGKYISQNAPTLTPRVYDLVFNQIDFRVLDVCCKTHVKNILDDHPLEPGILPEAIVYVLDTTLEEEKQQDSITEFKEWIQYLNEKFPKKLFQKIPFLVLFNKIDLNPGFDIDQYSELYNDEDFNLNIKYSSSSVVDGQGLNDSFSWLVQNMKLTADY
ncbi:MAG: hypothetical protein GF317_07060 [Candidatus Lokiarchaeota archaeon]|nr:hypothetical protein [Candidatus Lokiarchaeota archaeon]MBD3199467.1 hypothetical protein [Candidatus Lokiarchaeota archaeon]